MTSAKFGSASRPVLMPRMLTCMSPASAVCTTDTPGVSAMKSSGRSMPAFLICVCVKAVIVTGTSWMFSSRWRAVTTTSSIWPPTSAACSTAGTASSDAP